MSRRRCLRHAAGLFPRYLYLSIDLFFADDAPATRLMAQRDQAMRLAFDLLALALEQPLSVESHVGHLRAVRLSQSNLRGLCEFQRIGIERGEYSALTGLDLRARQFSIPKIVDAVGVKAQMPIPIPADGRLHPLVVDRSHFTPRAFSHDAAGGARESGRSLSLRVALDVRGRQRFAPVAPTRFGPIAPLHAVRIA